MSNHGFNTLLGIWRETTAFASPTAPTVRPGGLSSVGIARENAVSFTRANPYGQESAAEPLHSFHRVIITRALHIDDFNDWLLDAMRTTPPMVAADTPTTGIDRTTRETRIDTSNAFFGMDVKAADGQTIRLSGMTPTRIAYTVEIGRLVGQQVEFLALSHSAIEPGDARTADQADTSPLSPLNCSLRLGYGLDLPSPGLASAFTLSILFDRNVSPAQFTEEGNPTRAQTSGGWRATGTGTARLAPADSARIRTAGEHGYTLRADLRSGDGLLALRLPNAALQVTNWQPLSDFVHHNFEFLGLSTSDTPTFTTITEK